MKKFKLLQIIDLPGITRMAFSNLWLLLLLMLAFGCRQIAEEDLSGYWTYTSTWYEYSWPALNSLRFEAKKVEVEGEYGFLHPGVFEITNQTIHIHTKDEFDLALSILDLKEDTLVFQDSTTYVRSKDPYEDKFTGYSLLNLPSNDTLEQHGNLAVMAFFKNTAGQPVLRLADKIAKFEDIVFYTMGHHERSRPEIVLFLDKAISLTDLQELHTYLALNRLTKVNLVLSHTDLQTQKIFKYKITFWDEDLLKFRELNHLPAIPPPPPGEYSEKEFLKNGGVILKVDGNQDKHKFANLQAEGKYLISFRSTLPLAEYFRLKMELYQLVKGKRIQLRTEIN